MIQEFKKTWKKYTIGMIWVLGLLWPLLGIHPEGTLSFEKTFIVWSYIVAVTFVFFILNIMYKSGSLEFVTNPA